MADAPEPKTSADNLRIEKLPAYIQVADQIRRAIQLGQYVSGERLPPEVDLACQIGVSRTTLREAIRQLVGEGYLKSQPGAYGGLFVTQSDDDAESELGRLRLHWDDIEHFFDYRIAVECAAAALAASHRGAKDLKAMGRANDDMAHAPNHSQSRAADAAFHLIIVAATGNPYLRRAVEDARAGMFRPLDVFGFAHEMWAGQPDEHARILDGIAAGDADAASDAMREHIEGARRKIRVMIWDEKGAAARSR